MQRSLAWYAGSSEHAFSLKTSRNDFRLGVNYHLDVGCFRDSKTKRVLIQSLLSWEGFFRDTTEVMPDFWIDTDVSPQLILHWEERHQGKPNKIGNGRLSKVVKYRGKVIRPT